MKIFKACVLLAIVAGFFVGHAQVPAISTAASKKIDELISRMTPEEKAGQLNFIVGETIVTGPTMLTAESKRFDEQIRKGSITGLFNVYGAAYTKRLQKIAMEESRLKIPLLFAADIIHGFRTVTPIPLGESASWDLALIERSARMAADEATSAGIAMTFGPMVDVTRDPRWGRVAEGSGEDPYLGSMIAAARVRGYQGTDLAAPNTLAACVKHFVGYGAAEGGRDYNTVDLSRRVLYETFLPPFKAAIDAGAASLMPSFNEFDGIPATANKHLLREILRTEWKYTGLVISDYGAVGETINHGLAADGSEAARLSLEAGTDLDMMSFLYVTQIPKLVSEGKLSAKHLDEAVRRVLELKYALGLFDNPYRYSDEGREKKTVRSASNIAVAREVARKSIVLLRNEGSVLPLKPEHKTIAVIGPLADKGDDMNGTWSFFGEGKEAITVLQGIKNRARGASVMHHQGCNLYDHDETGLAGAVETAKKADVVLLVVGESAVMNGEGASRSDIGLPGGQENLARAIAATGKPVVAVLVNGRPLTLEWLDANIPAIVETWALGSEAGNAIADVLFGDYNPSGKLPMSFPRTVGQIPLYYNHKNTGRPYGGTYNEPADQRQYVSKYRDTKNTPLYPFGFGLSYSRFEYSNLTLSNAALTQTTPLKVAVTVTNKSDRDGEEVVQLYVRDLTASVTRPVKELKGFQKVMIRAGESKTVTFTLAAQDVAFYRADMSWGTEPGAFEVFVGGDSEHVINTKFELTE